MENIVICKGFNFVSQDIEDMITELNKIDITLINYNQTNFISPDVIGTLVIQFVYGIPYNAAYDAMKYILFLVMDKVSHSKVSECQTCISIEMNNKVSKVAFSFHLNEEQKNKIVDTVAQKLLKDN